MKQQNDFLEICKNILDVENITPKQFGFSAVIAYVYKLGWNKGQFYGHPNRGKKEEVLGVDMAISRAYNHARQGSRSSTMRFIEKYTWTAVHEIMGFLADRLAFSDYYNELRLLDNYLLLLEIPNCLQEIENGIAHNFNFSQRIYLPSDISPPVDELNTANEENLKEWIKNAPYPDFSRWLSSNEIYHFFTGIETTEEWTILCNYFEQTENFTLGDSVMWTTAMIIDSTNLTLLTHSFNQSNFDAFKYYFTTNHLQAYIPRNSYLSPIEVCSLPWLNEENSFIDIVINKNQKKLRLYPTVVEVDYNHPIEGEKYYKIPTKLVREVLDIRKGNGIEYMSDVEVVAYFNKNIEGYMNKQTFLICNKDRLLRKLNNDKQELIWFVRMFREPSYKSRSLHDGFAEKDVLFLIWVKNGEFKQLQIERPTNEI